MKMVKSQIDLIFLLSWWLEASKETVQKNSQTWIFIYFTTTTYVPQLSSFLFCHKMHRRLYTSYVYIFLRSTYCVCVTQASCDLWKIREWGLCSKGNWDESYVKCRSRPFKYSRVHVGVGYTEFKSFYGAEVAIRWDILFSLLGLRPGVDHFTKVWYIWCLFYNKLETHLSNASPELVIALQM